MRSRLKVCETAVGEQSEVSSNAISRNSKYAVAMCGTLFLSDAALFRHILSSSELAQEEGDPTLAEHFVEVAFELADDFFNSPIGVA